MAIREDHEQTLQPARNAALRALAVRSRSVAEMRTRLGRRYSDDVVHSVVRDLQEQGLLNDADFAQAWRQSRERSRPRSAALVRHELLSRGVDRSMADAIVADMDDPGSAERLARSQMRRYSSLAPEQAYRRLDAALRRRGFTHSVIESTLRLLMEEHLQPDDGDGVADLHNGIESSTGSVEGPGGTERMDI